MANLNNPLEVLKMYCGGEFFDFWQLAGSAKSSVRKHIMEVLTGEKQQAAKCGVNRLENEFFNRYNVTGDCPRNRTEAFKLIVNQ